MIPQRHHAVNHCLGCGRPLSSTVSIKRRIGPICWKRVEKENTHEDRKTDDRVIDPALDCRPGEDIFDYTARFKGHVGHSTVHGRASLRMSEDGIFQIYVRWHGNLVDTPESILYENEDLHAALRWGNRFFGTDDRVVG
jgi:hypothetical protein